MCHESNTDNGAVIESAAGWATKVTNTFLIDYMNSTNIQLKFIQLETARGKGAFLRSSLTEQVSPERVRDEWQNVVDMTQAQSLTPSKRRDELVKVLTQLKSGGNSLLSTPGPKHHFRFGSKDLILYALGGKIFSRILNIEIKTNIFFSF